MTELVQKYLGNSLENPALAQQLEEKGCWEVYLSSSDRPKGRIYTQSTSGVAIGIVKNRDWMLQEGDVLATEEGQLLLVHLQTQKLLVISFTQSVGDRAIELIHLGHVLGNHHYPILVQNNKIYLQLVTDAEVIEKTIRDFAIPGLQIEYEERSPQQQLTFESHSHHS